MLGFAVSQTLVFLCQETMGTAPDSRGTQWARDNKGHHPRERQSKWIKLTGMSTNLWCYTATYLEKNVMFNSSLCCVMEFRYTVGPASCYSAAVLEIIDEGQIRQGPYRDCSWR